MHSSNYNSTSINKVLKFTEITTPNIANILMGLGLLMEGPMAQALLDRSGGASAEPVINATSSEQNATVKPRVLIVLASLCKEILSGYRLIVFRIWIRMRVHPGTQEARQGFTQRSSTTSSGGSSKWGEISNWSVFGGEITH